jgi:hypothetical protein
VKGASGAETLTPNQETSVAKGSAPLHPFALKRFARMRRFMQGHRRRLAALNKRWKAMPPAQRRAHRQQVMKRMRNLRRQMRQKRQQRRQLIQKKHKAGAQ